MSEIRAQDLLPENSYPSLNLRTIGEVLLRLPPVHEQRRIVAILDEALDGIARARANIEQNLAGADSLFVHVLSTLFEEGRNLWELSSVRALGTVQTGSTPKTSISEYYGEEIPFIKPADFAFDGTLEYAHDGLSETGKNVARVISPGSVLMVCIGATIGKVGFCDRAITTNQQINSVTPVEGILPKFVYYQMKTAGFQQAVRDGAGQATLPIISKGKWSELPIYLPSDRGEQDRIVARLDTVQASVANLRRVYEAKLADLDTVRQSILAEAFRGELR